MKNFLYVRLLFLKKRPFPVIFWMLFPLIATVLVMQFTTAAKSETRIPVAIVLNDHSAAGASLLGAMKQNELLRIGETSEADGRAALRQNKYDSLFIIPEDFSGRIARGETDDLIEGYRSERSLFFTATKEMILANVQATSGRMQAALTVQQLNEQLNGDAGWSKETIIRTADRIENEQQLLQTTFRLATGAKTETVAPLISPFMPWAAASMLATFFIFSVIARERRKLAFTRLGFTRMNGNVYINATAAFYTGILLLFDILAFTAINVLYNETFHLEFIIALLGYRITSSGIALIFASFINRSSVYYSSSMLFTIGITLLSIYGHAPARWNPVAALPDGQTSIPFLTLALLAPLLAGKRKEDIAHA